MSSSSSKPSSELSKFKRAQTAALREVTRKHLPDLMTWVAKTHADEFLLWLSEKHGDAVTSLIRDEYSHELHEATNIELERPSGAVSTASAASSSRSTGAVNAGGWKGLAQNLTNASSAAADDVEGDWQTTAAPTAKEMATLGSYINNQLVGHASEEINGKKSFIKVGYTVQGAGKLLLELSQGQPDRTDKIYFVRATCKANGDTTFMVTKKGSHVPVATYTRNTLKIMNEKEDINAVCQSIWETHYPRMVVKTSPKA